MNFYDEVLEESYMTNSVNGPTQEIIKKPKVFQKMKEIQW